MLENNDDLMSIVVLEAGAAWPAWLTEYQKLAPNAVVIAQARSESCESLGARVAHRVGEALNDDGVRVRVGVIVAADVDGESRGAARESIARTLIRAMRAQSGEADLVLAGDNDDLEASRHELFALTGTLCEELGGSKVSVRVRFSNAKSGIMRSAAPSAPDVEPLVIKA
jgi:hypothetical protein